MHIVDAEIRTRQQTDNDLERNIDRLGKTGDAHYHDTSARVETLASMTSKICDQLQASIQVCNPSWWCSVHAYQEEMFRSCSVRVPDVCQRMLICVVRIELKAGGTGTQACGLPMGVYIHRRD